MPKKMNIEFLMKTDIKDSFKLFKSYNGINAIQEKMNKIQKLNT